MIQPSTQSHSAEAEVEISVSPVTGKSYRVPTEADDSSVIETFLMANPGKPVVAVQGLGFVGAVMALVCANPVTGHYAVLGVDVPGPAGYWKICELNAGTFPVVASDPKIEQFYQSARRQGNLLATGNPSAYGYADVVIVDINLDVEKENLSDGSLKAFDVDLGAFTRAIEAIGKNCKPDCLILVETTVPPGTCEKVVAPTIRRLLEARDLPSDNVAIGHSYERVMPGPDYVDSIQNFYRVYSGINEASADRTEAFLRSIIRTDEYPLTRLGSTNATEMAKVLENSYRAMNIAFAVEWSRFAEESAVNLYEVVRAIRMRPTHANLMLPGLGVGGYCLTKDPLLASWARTDLLCGAGPLPQSEQAVRINDQMPKFAFERLSDIAGSIAGRKVLLLGASYRSDIGDTRYSPVEPFYRRCVQEASSVSVVDPYVRYWEELDLELSTTPRMPAEGTIYDIIVITTGHREFTLDYLLALLVRGANQLVFDTVGRLGDSEIQHLGEIARVSVLGRGDLRYSE